MDKQLTLYDFTREKYKIPNKIRLIELFAGIGSQAKALKNLGADFETYKVVEFDKYAIASYNAIHGTDFPIIDITEIDGAFLDIRDTDNYTYIMTYSFPCFTEDTLVLTNTGYKSIADVKVDDLVLTHNNRYKKVVASGCTGENETLVIKGMGVHEIVCTPNHKFYVREMKKRMPTGANGKRYRTREFLNAEWVDAKDLSKKHYLGVAVNQNASIPEWNGKELSKYMGNQDFWWLIGRYVGDGWIRKGGGITICCAKNELTEITDVAEKLQLPYAVDEERTVKRVRFNTKELTAFVEPFGRGAKNKTIPGFVIDLPKELAKGFLDGYVSADGCFSKGLFKTTTISKGLAYGTGQLVGKVYNVPYRLYKTKRPKNCSIEGRTVNQNDDYQVVWKLEKKKQDKAFFEDGYIWYPIKSIEKGTVERTYDITVEEDHSFTANNTIVHNCQDLSVAGHRKGMARDTGTRSGLLWEVERLLNEVESLPQVLLMENVPMVHSKDNIGEFTEWIEFLRSKGYSNFWQDLNAKDYGVAQNRDRCFMVSILGDWNYSFPDPIPLTKCMKDYLEDTVDEKFYINSPKAQKLIQQLVDGGVQPNTAVDGTIGNPRAKEVASSIIARYDAGIQNKPRWGTMYFEKVDPVILTDMGSESDEREPGIRKTDIATTLLARDYKGLDNYGSNAVVCKNEDENGRKDRSD